MANKTTVENISGDEALLAQIQEEYVQAEHAFDAAAAAVRAYRRENSELAHLYSVESRAWAERNRLLAMRADLLRRLGKI